MNYSYTSTTKPGKSDPYWYEWSVGEKYLLDMLYEESNIEAVAFQGNISLGLDDVVVYYKDESIKCIQVKHTRADDTLTYADLVSPKSDGKISLLGELAESWHKERNNYKIIVPQIFTNRKLGEKVSTTKRADGFKRPALKDFLLELKGQLHNDNTQYSDIHFDGYEQAWEEWKEQLSVIPEDKDRIEFLRLLEIETSQPDLESIEKQLIEETALVFGVNENIATELFTKLDQKMRYWTSTLANKGLEVIEAHWLFDMPYDKIDVVVHPQSIVHSMVEFTDGSVIAQMGLPDMRLPIQYAFSYPERYDNAFGQLDFVKAGTLTFLAPDTEAFPALKIAVECGRQGGTLPCAFNAANEEAVYAFLDGKIKYMDIVKTIEHVVGRHQNILQPVLEDIENADASARCAAKDFLSNL